MASIELWYILIIIAEFIILIGASIYSVFMLQSWLGGAPYVATKQSDIDRIVDNITVKNGSYVYELGCGDGRFIRTMAKKNSVIGVGIDINPIVIFIARLLTYTFRLKNLTFIRQNVLSVDFSRADILYIYMFPAVIKKLENKLTNNRLKPLQVVSHGFKIQYLNKYYNKEIIGDTMKTYFYLIH